MKHAKRRILVAAALAGGLLAGSTAPVNAADEVYIITAVETKGESAVAIPDTADGAQFAIDEINKAGGVTINGKKSKIKYERIPVGSTAAAADTAARQIVDKKPTAVIGFISTSHNPAAAPIMKAAGIPTIFLNTGSTLAIGAAGSVGAPNIFRMRPTQSALAAEQFKFLFEKFKKDNGGKSLTKAGMICVDGAFGKAGCDTYGFFANRYGVTITKREGNSITATDLSAQVTSICNSGAEAILSVNYPNPAAAFMNEMVNRGCKLPIVEGASGDIAVLSGAFTPPAGFKLYSAVDCHPAASAKGTSAKKFSDAFTKKYGYPAGYSAAEAYDGIYLLKAAIEKANSTVATNVVKGITTQTYKGVCYDKYSPKSVATGITSNILVNKGSIVSYVGKVPTIESTVVLPK